MPLSEHEQRLFEQIERSLAEDPKFASAVRASDPRFHTRRRLLVAAGVVIAGLALLVYGVMTTPLLSVAGFVVMLAALGYAVQSHRRAQSPDLHVVGGTTSRRRPRGGRTGRRGSFLDRMEDRWRQRPEGHR
ncbi:DUF3040 family protein [Micromonospora kangleipakensis]|uniref:DUF3040 family protein n=1 Tax=Micromonospora kangleipakensis TaxID=1077942 RepID=A0A4Q8BIK3_9ACTN|nr:DUF3040 domain-containing protein [Micromonospora kangleipakensis]RZU77223.1 DUF3040 family protein [Micromonospora kangleipakensis]